MEHRRVQALLLALLAGLMTATISHATLGAGEIYTLTESPGRIQEVNLPGAALILNVTSATVNTNYRFTWIVTDPAGLGRTAVNSTTTGPTQTSFVLSVVYPRDFPAGTLVRYVGNYTVNVSQSQPSNKPTVATGQFVAGLTDNLNYQRTIQLSAKALGYAINENVTINVSHGGNLAPSFPRWNFTDANGAFTYRWPIPAAAAIGPYSLTLTGAKTTKAITDTQTFNVYPTNVTISQLSVTSSYLQRTQTQGMIFSATYPDASSVRTGQVSLRITETDGTTTHFTTASYDPTLGLFRAGYRIPLNGQSGIWVAIIDPNGFDDSYGNGGPQTTVAKGFAVQPATLSISVSSGNKTYAAGEVIPLYSKVTSPDGTLFTSGTVTATLFHAGLQIRNPIALSFIAGQGAWAGSYQVNVTDPSGIWVVNVAASDSYGNAGQQSSSAIVSIPPGQPSQQPSLLNTVTFFAIAAILAIVTAALLIWALFWSRRKISKRQVKLDLKFVDAEVEKIEHKDFFQNIKEQVENKKPQAADETKNPEQPKRAPTS